MGGERSHLRYSFGYQTKEEEKNKSDFGVARL